MTLKPGTPKLPRNVEHALVAVGDSWPVILEGGRIEHDGVRVSNDGIFDDRGKVADLGAVLQQSRHADVIAIAEPKHGHWVRNTLITVGLVWLALAAALAIIDPWGPYGG